jgi:uncharacterized protein (DUF1330 family)
VYDKGAEMPKGYMIATVEIRNRAGFEAYVQQALPTIQRAGGRPIVVDDHPEELEGSWHGPRTVLLEFDSVDAARAWYRSPEYQAVIGGRHQAAESNVVIVGGFVMPG